MANMIAPIVVKDAPERKVFGPVLIPNEPDYDGDIVTEEKIEQIHDLFNEKYGNIDVQHSLQNVGKIYTSYILAQETSFEFDGEAYVFPKGTWMMGVKVTDDEAWNLVEQGILTGFSIMAINPLLKDSATKGEDGRTTLADLGNDWIVNAVSLVNNPAVPKAKFIAIKSAPTEETLVDKILKSLQGIINLIQVKKSDEANKEINQEVQVDMTPEQVQEMINTALAPILEMLQAMKEQPEVEKAEEVEEVAEKAAEEVVETTEVEKTEDSNTETEATEEVVKEEEVVESTETQVDETAVKLEEALAKIAELEAAQKSTYSKRLLGQDGLGNEVQKSQNTEDRDLFGRKKRV